MTLVKKQNFILETGGNDSDHDGLLLLLEFTVSLNPSLKEKKKKVG